MRFEIRRRMNMMKPFEVRCREWNGVVWRPERTGPPDVLSVQLPGDQQEWRLLVHDFSGTGLIFRGPSIVAEIQPAGRVGRSASDAMCVFADEAVGTLSIACGWRRTVVRSSDRGGMAVAVGAWQGWRNQASIVVRPSYGRWAGALVLIVTSTWAAMPHMA